MAAYPEEQPFGSLYSYSDHQLLPSGSSSYHPLTNYDHSVHHDSTSQLQTRRSAYSQQDFSSGPNLNSYQQFLREEEERFLATFPDAAKAAAQQHTPALVVLGDDYRTFGGGAAFTFGASHTYPLPSPAHGSNVALNMQNRYSGEYLSPGSSSHASYPYSLNHGGIPSPEEGYNHLGTEPVSLPTASFYSPQSIEDSEQDHQDHHGFQHELHPISLSPTIAHSPHMPPPESDFPVFPPVASHHSRMYSLSPEAVVAGSPTSPTPLQSSLSPVAMVPQPEQLSLPPLPPESQSDSEQPADDPSGSSSSKAVLPRTSAKRKRRHNLSEELQNDPSSGSPRAYMGKIPLPKPTSTPVPKAPKSRLASQSEKKSLSLACFFCRGRKIACGPQDPNSADRTCNQCHRRSLKCEYPTESRRGMRKNKSGTMNQGFRAEKGFVEAAAPKVAARASTSTSDPKV